MRDLAVSWRFLLQSDSRQVEVVPWQYQYQTLNGRDEAGPTCRRHPPLLVADPYTEVKVGIEIQGIFTGCLQFQGKRAIAEIARTTRFQSA